MGKPRTEEERKAQNQKRSEKEEQRRKSYVIPEHLKDPVPIQKSVFDRFTTCMLLEGKEVEILITPEPGYPRIEGLPTVYCIDIDHSFFGWLHYTSEAWYMSPEKPQEVIEMVVNVVQVYYE